MRPIQWTTLYLCSRDNIALMLHIRAIKSVLSLGIQYWPCHSSIIVNTPSLTPMPCATKRELHKPAICGPRYKIKVCKPVPKPTELSTPKPTHHRHHNRYFSAACICSLCGPSTWYKNMPRPNNIENRTNVNLWWNNLERTNVNLVRGNTVCHN